MQIGCTHGYFLCNMKEIVTLLKEENKEFVSFTFMAGAVFVNYNENNKFHSVHAFDNLELETRTILIIGKYIYKILNSLY